LIATTRLLAAVRESAVITPTAVALETARRTPAEAALETAAEDPIAVALVSAGRTHVVTAPESVRGTTETLGRTILLPADLLVPRLAAARQREAPVVTALLETGTEEKMTDDLDVTTMTTSISVLSPVTPRHLLREE
jgi:hypothetical protein